VIVRRRRVVASHAQLTTRDLEVLRDVVRFGALTVQQVSRRHFSSRQRANARLAALVAGGYLRGERVWYRGPSIYLATPAGARLADVGLPPGHLAVATLRHHLAVADLAEHLLAEHPGASWVTERELRRDGMTAVRDRGDGRLLEGLPHVPDGVLVLGDGSRVAVELEASPKRQSAYERIFAWYAGTFDYAAVRWFCPAPAVEARLRKLVERQQVDDLISVEGLPRRPAAWHEADRWCSGEKDLSGDVQTHEMGIL